MLSGGVLDEVGDVLDDVGVEVGDQSNSTVALAGTAHLYSVLTVTMSLALCHSNIARVKIDKRMLSTRQASWIRPCTNVPAQKLLKSLNRVYF